MERKLFLNDQTVLENSEVIKSGSILWVYVYADISFGNLFLTLNNENATRSIRAVWGENETVYEGFTELFCMRKEDDNFLTAGLRRGV